MLLLLFRGQIFPWNGVVRPMPHPTFPNFGKISKGWTLAEPRLHPYKCETRKGRPIETIVEGEQPIPALGSVSANQEVSHNTARAGVPSSPAPCGIFLKRPSRGTPDCFLQVPLDGDTRVPEE